VNLISTNEAIYSPAITGKATQKEQASADIKMHDGTSVQASPIVIPSSTPSPAPTLPVATQNTSLSVTSLVSNKRKGTTQQEEEERSVKVPRTVTNLALLASIHLTFFAH
jgi:hypothetical protein